MAQSVSRRILVLGCSRSGTTLLQGMLAAHSRVHTFPETGVFLSAFGRRGIVLPWVHLGLTVGKERKALAKLLESQKRAPGPLPEIPPRRLSLRRSLADAVTFMDALALAHGKDVWVEKTPRHVFHARRIRRSIPGSLCVHLLRDGRDVVASVVDRARRHPNRFPRQADPFYGIRQWNRSLRASERAAGDVGHALVFYERLVSDVKGTLAALCNLAGLEFQEAMIEPADRTGFSAPEEVWKSGVDAPVEPAPSKFKTLFDEEARRRIVRRLDLSTYRKLRKTAEGRPGGILGLRGAPAGSRSP